MPEDNRTPYRYIGENFGGTYTFNDNIPHIGTSNLTTCVGFYLPIDEDRCFVAHVNASATERTGTTDASSISHLHPKQADFIIKTVREKLQKNAAENDWTAQDVFDSVQRGKEAILMCPSLGDADDERSVGKLVLQGISNFFGEEHVWRFRYHCNDRSVQGFVVERGTGNVHLLPYRERRAEDRRLGRAFGDVDAGFKQVLEFPMADSGEWKIVAPCDV